MNGNGQQSSSGPMVDAQDVHKYFHGNEVLKGINMQVAKGEVVVLIGASGSGKTTFLRCVNHLEKIDKGRIYVDGELIGYQVSAQRQGCRGEREGECAPPQQYRLRLPALQSLPAPHRAAEHHRGADAGQGHRAPRGRGARAASC